MRQRFYVTLGAGGRWPDAVGGNNLPAFNWVKVDNRGAGAVTVGLNPQPGASDALDYLLQVPAGVCRVFNVAGANRDVSDDPGNAWPSELHLVSSAGSTVMVEIADHPIVDLMASPGAATGVPTYVRLEDGTTSTLAAVLAAAQGDGIAQAAALEAIAHGYVWNGTAWDKVRAASAAVLAAQSGIGAEVAALPGNWTANNAPAAGSAASASKAAAAAGVRHVCTNVAFGFSASTALAGASTVTVNLRDGATGAGTVLKTWQFTLPAATVAPVHVELSGLSEVGTAATAMTLEFAAAVGNLMTYCDLGGYDAS